MEPIELTKDQKEELEELTIKCEGYHCTIQRLSYDIVKTQEKLWKKIKRWYPDLKDVESGLAYNREKGKIEKANDC